MKETRIPTRADQPDACSVKQKINADFAVFRFVPAEAEIDKTDSLKRTVDGLFDEVIEDVAKRSRLLHKRSVTGKSADDLSQRTLSTLKVMKEKLNGLRFLNGGVAPMIDLINRLLSLMPTRGKFTPDQFNALNAALSVLCSEQLLVEVATGKLTLDSYLANALPGFAKTDGVPEHDTTDCTPALSNSHDCPSHQDEPRQNDLSLEPRVTEPKEVSSEGLPLSSSERDSDSPASSITPVSQSESPVPNQQGVADDFDDLEMLNRMLANCFDSPVLEDQDHDTTDIPPAPTQIRLSAF